MLTPIPKITFSTFFPFVKVDVMTPDTFFPDNNTSFTHLIFAILRRPSKWSNASTTASEGIILRPIPNSWAGRLGENKEN